MDTTPPRADPLWTLDELVERAGRALSADPATADPAGTGGAVRDVTPAGGGPGDAPTSGPSKRVRQLPDRRAVRWYASIGLVDRPGVMRGRVALYGSRQLLQLVAVKRRQAQGARLADIQAELAGASDAELAAIAAVDPDLLAGSATADTPETPVRPRFWLDPPAATPPAGRPATPAAATAPVPATSPAPATESLPATGSLSATGSLPAAEAPTGTQPAGPARPAAGRSAAAPPIAGMATAGTVPAHRTPAPPAGVVHGVALGDGAVLLLPPGAAAPTAELAAEVRAAAAPLLAVLAGRRGAGPPAAATRNQTDHTDRTDRAGRADHTDRTDRTEPQEEPR